MKLWALIKGLSANLNTFWQSGDSNVDKTGFFSPSKLKCQKVYIGRKGNAVTPLIFWQNHHSQSEGTFFSIEKLQQIFADSWLGLKYDVWYKLPQGLCITQERESRAAEGEGSWREKGKRDYCNGSSKKCLGKGSACTAGSPEYLGADSEILQLSFPWLLQDLLEPGLVAM